MPFNLSEIKKLCQMLPLLNFIPFGNRWDSTTLSPTANSLSRIPEILNSMSKKGKEAICTVLQIGPTEFNVSWCTQYFQVMLQNIGM